MTTRQSRPIDENGDREIVSTRVFATSRERVFDAFADGSQVVLWWGPNGFTDTLEVMDLRPGGAWRHVMHGPDGTDYHNACLFDEVTRPGRIVFRHLEPMHHFQMTMIFAEEAGGTRLTWRMLFDSPSECAKVRQLIVPANEQNFDRLAAHLAVTS